MMFRSIFGWAPVIALVILGAMCRSQEPSETTSRLRASVSKAIPMLEAGSMGSADQRQCFTCHSQAIPVFALLQAKQLGFSVDEKNIQRQIQHTFDHLQRGLSNYKQGKGQGGGVLTAGYAMWTLEEGGWPQDEVTEAVVHYLLETQSERPSWRHPGTRPPSSGSDFTTTYVALRSIDKFATESQQDRHRERRRRAMQWLLRTVPVETEDHVFRLRSLKYAENSSSELEACVQSLLQKQQPDGGWGQKDDMSSDAYATGTVLETLLVDGNLKTDHSSVQKAVDYLLKTQQSDGTWKVTTRAKPVQEYFESGFPHEVDQFISIAATAWSTLALLKALPIEAKANAVQPNMPPVTSRAKEKYDLVLKQGRVVDGTGAPWYIADIAIKNGKIAKIGRVESQESEVELDIAGRVVTPGWIDMMGQSASPFLDQPKSALNLLTQGITTINAGEGISAAPLDPQNAKQQGWTTMVEYFALLESKGLPVNVVQTVGHTQVRKIVIGDDDRRPSQQELSQMKDLVREAMRAGAIGLSTALIYPPAIYAQQEEIMELARVAGDSGGHYFTHMRNEGDQLLEAIDEALEIGRQAKTPVHIFHLKTAGQQNWGKMPLAIARIKAARAAGEQVTADIYPYINNGLEIAALIHPRHFSQGRERLRNQLDDLELRQTIRSEMESTLGWENWYRHVGNDWDRIVIGQTNDRKYRESVGQSIAKIAAAHHRDPWDVFFDMVKAGSFALPQSMTDANKILAMQQEFVSFCTDVGPASSELSASHPRGYGAFPRLFSKYVRDLGVLSLERAVAQASAAAANSVMAYDRGRIAEGLAADLVVMDFEKLQDNASFSNPAAVSSGIQHVLVNGELVLKDGELTLKRPGRVLRGPGYDVDKAAFNVTSGATRPEFAQLDRRMRDFMEKHRVPGAAIAIAEQGKLVYSRGFGYADLATQEPVQPTSLFRIASVSKPITAIAILQLVEQGLLKLDDRVLSVLELESEIQSADESFDARWRDVTIQHLLEHRGGWDRDQSFDPMFESVRFAQQWKVPAPAGPSHVILSMLRQKLDFPPGERYAYSNFGYCLLGRVIEKVSGQSYETKVKASILQPLGIQRMRLGGTRLEDRAPSEVRYYAPGKSKSVFQIDLGENVASPYGAWHLEAMDSHGGWIASAEDLIKLACALDEPNKCPILTRDSIHLMYARPPGLAGHDEKGVPKDVYYSLGWNNRVVSKDAVNHWHTGSLPGTATILIRRHDGRNMVALLNSRVSPTAEHLAKEIDQLLQQK